MARKIIHIDMDCFYAAVEMRDDPALRAVPLAVGGTSPRGVICTCNYRARRHGVRSAMPVFLARRTCPDLVCVRPDFSRYEKESATIREIFREFTPTIEPLSLDEAFLDVSHDPRPGAAIARLIRRRIAHVTGLPASAGIAPNKLLAKIASDWRKPNGQFEVRDEEADAFTRDLPLRRIWGIGPKTEERLRALGLSTCGDLRQLDPGALQRIFGSFGTTVADLCRGVDDRPVEPRQRRKTMSVEHTLEDPVRDDGAAAALLETIRRELLADLQANPELARQVAGTFVKVKFTDFTLTTKSAAGHQPDRETVANLGREAFGRKSLGARLLGVGVRFAETEGGAAGQLEFALDPGPAKK